MEKIVDPDTAWLPAERCDCGNRATESGGTCEWCIPHDHDPVVNQHDFSWPAGICSRCRFMAQDCCEKATECPGVRRV